MFSDKEADVSGDVNKVAFHRDTADGANATASVSASKSTSCLIPIKADALGTTPTITYHFEDGTTNTTNSRRTTFNQAIQVLTSGTTKRVTQIDAQNDSDAGSTDTAEVQAIELEIIEG